METTFCCTESSSFLHLGLARRYLEATKLAEFESCLRKSAGLQKNAVEVISCIELDGQSRREVLPRTLIANSS